MNKIGTGALVALGYGLLSTSAWADVGAEMEAEGDVGAQIDAEGDGDAEADGDAEGDGDDGDGDGDGAAKASVKASGGGAAPVAPVERGDVFVSPSGPTGQGLSLSASQSGRAWGEVGLHTSDTYTIVSPMLGGGYKVTDSIELELVVPLVYASFTFPLLEDSSFNMGNLYAGVNVLGGSGELKYKFGGGLGFPTSSASDIGDAIAYSGGAGIHAAQQFYLWAPENLTLNGIGRIEYGNKVIFTGDAMLSIYFPTGDVSNDNELTIGLAPGIGAWLGDDALLGGRVLVWYGSFGDDNAQLGVEPYFRYHFGDAFINARFTLNIDEPYGFSFDDGGLWGLHLGGGLSF